MKNSKTSIVEATVNKKPLKLNFTTRKGMPSKEVFTDHLNINTDFYENLPFALIDHLGNKVSVPGDAIKRRQVLIEPASKKPIESMEFLVSDGSGSVPSMEAFIKAWGIDELSEFINRNEVKNSDVYGPEPITDFFNKPIVTDSNCDPSRIRVDLDKVEAPLFMDEFMEKFMNSVVTEADPEIKIKAAEDVDVKKSVEPAATKDVMPGKHTLHFCFYGAAYASEGRHPQEVMKELGIEYEAADPRSMGDCWFFHGCTNIPDKLPSFITVRDDVERPSFL